MQDDAYCQSIGAAKGTPQYTSCRLTVTQQRENKHNIARAALLSSSSSTTCSRYGTTVTCNSW
jgi:hypothetical protein